MHGAVPVEDEPATVVGQQRDVGGDRRREHVRERQPGRTRRDTKSDPTQRTVRADDVRARSIRCQRESARRVDSWVIRSRGERVDGRRAAKGMHATEPIQHVPARRASKRNATGDVPSLPVGSVDGFRRCRVAVEPKTVEAAQPVEDEPGVAVRRNGDATRDVPVRPIRQPARYGGRAAPADGPGTALIPTSARPTITSSTSIRRITQCLPIEPPRRGPWRRESPS